MDLETAAQAYHDAPSPERAAAVVRAGEPLVANVVSETPSHPVYGEWQERFSVGLAVLYEALTRWEPAVGSGSFASFAYMRIKGAIYTHLRRCLHTRRVHEDHHWHHHDRLDRTWDVEGETVTGYDFVAAPSAEEPFADELRETVLRVIDKVLTSKQRRSLLLYYYAGVNQAAQAEEDGVSQSAIARRLIGAHKALSGTSLSHYAT